MKINSILEIIGKTPHLRLNKLYSTTNPVWIKLERQNPGGSIKDRIAIEMIEDAERSGVLKPESIIVEPTSGNTGIGLALVGAVKGYKVVLVMPESMSAERRRIMAAYGASFVLTPRELGMRGAIEKAGEMAQADPNVWVPMQFANTANVQAHIKNTAQEILSDFPDGLDYLVSGVGTGGHITGVAKVLKEKFPALKVIAVEPAASPVLSGNQPGSHPIQGIGAGFVPQVLDLDLIDEIVQITKDEAYEYTRLAASKEGLFVGISTGASLAAVAKKLTEIEPHSRVLTFNYDTGERYLSVDDLFEI